MKNILFALFAVSVPIGAAVYIFVPLYSPKEICTAVEAWGGADQEASRLNRPMGLAWGGGFLYVADTENGAIKKFRKDGSLVAKWTGFQRPVAVAVMGDVVYVADFLTDRVTKLRSDGTLIARWGRNGAGNGELDAPSGIAVDSGGNIFVADFYNHRIQKFTGEGNFLLQWGSEGRRSGRFRYPTEIAVNDRDEVLVADAYNHRIQKFTSDGDYIAEWGGIGYGIPGKWPGWFRLAKAVAVDSRGNVYVADAFNRRLQKFTGGGEYLGQWSNPDSGDNRLEYPAGVAIDPEGRVYVSDFFENRIWKLKCD